MVADLGDLARLRRAVSRAVSAENPTGAPGAGARADPGEDSHCSEAASELGRGWKVRPCLRDLAPGDRASLADLEGPGVVRHIWITVPPGNLRTLALRVTYDDATGPSIEVPLGDFFANGVDGLARVRSLPVAVLPAGGMNCYWPMPFRERIRIEVSNDGNEPLEHLFYQVDFTLEDVPADCGSLHACWHRSTTTRERPEHVILDGVSGRGHYVGTYLVWNQLANLWWGEGEVKFFIDGDAADAPTICGTGTEDYFGGAWGFSRSYGHDARPETYSSSFLGYPQALFGADPVHGPRVPVHALFRWHIPDPVHFARDLRVTVQALGWWPDGRYQPRADDIASTALWYQLPVAPTPRPLPGADGRLPR